MTAPDPGRICVLGAGAIGSSVGADLSDAGHDVTLADMWPAQVETIRMSGLTVRMPDRELHVHPPALHLGDLAGSARRFDLILLAAKSNDHRWLAELARSHLAPEGVLVGLMNGMNDASLAGILGRDRVIGAVIELSAEIFAPGQVRRNTPPERTWFALGELDGTLTPRLEATATLLRHSARVDITANIAGAKWSKLIANAMTMGPFGLFGLYNHEAAQLPGIFDLSCRLGREALDVGEALGHRIEPVFGLTEEEFQGSSAEKIVIAMKTLMGHTSRGRTAPIHDHLKGRQSEIRFINGLVCDEGRRLGIPTPANDAVVEIDRRINAGLLPMDVRNLDLLTSLIAAADGAPDRPPG
jgi:2-dehydropantoate 2-reductase